MGEVVLPQSPSEMASECSLETLESKGETHHLDVEPGPEICMAHVCVHGPSPSSSLSSLSMECPPGLRRRRTPAQPSTKAIFAMGFMAVVGLFSVRYKTNPHGSVPTTDLFFQPPMSFGLFLAIVMIIFYFAAIGMIIKEVFPLVFRALNLVAFVLLVLGVTVLLWALIPNSFCWVPWLLFSCTVMAALGVLIYERFASIRSYVKKMKEYFSQMAVWTRRSGEN